MTCIRPGDCAVCQESIRDPFGSAYLPGLSVTYLAGSNHQSQVRVAVGARPGERHHGGAFSL